MIEARANALGLATRRDAGSNLVVTLAGSNRGLPALACGSHIDSVPRGGNFDGAAGVVAGLVALARLRDDDFRPARDIQLIVLRGEESARFGRVYMGSSVLFGELTQRTSPVRPVTRADACRMHGGGRRRHPPFARVRLC